MSKFLVPSVASHFHYFHSNSRPRLCLLNSIHQTYCQSKSTSCSVHTIVDRRRWLISLWLLQQQLHVARADSVDEYVATSAEELADLVDTVPDGSVITLQSKEYALQDTLKIEKPLTLRGSGASRLSVHTLHPYVSVLQCSGGSGPIRLRGFSVTHLSPSVANNYAVYLIDGDDICLEELDIQSETGTGVAIEGGRVRVQDCMIHDCASNGIGIFSTIVGEDASRSTIQGKRNVRNRRNGVLIKGAGSPVLESNHVEYNREFGINIADSEPRVAPSNILSSNTMGAMSLDSLSRVLDTL